MAQPTSRDELIEYAKRQLGAPVLEINVADEQCDDIVDDALQFFYERHFDGVMQCYLKYKITKEDKERGRAPAPTAGGSYGGKTGIGLTSDSSIIPNNQPIGTGTTVNFQYLENSNYIQIPKNIIGVNKVFNFDGFYGSAYGMFDVRYQMALNDMYAWGSMDTLSYAMTKRYMSDIDFLFTPDKQIRFNQRAGRLYLDISWDYANKDDYLVIDCWRTTDPNDYERVWNDSFLKPYVTALMKKQWGQNMMKFTGVKLPGGVELNGRQMYDDAQQELAYIRERMSNTYELPPMDMIG